MSRTKPFDEQGYIERVTTGPCFICEMLSGNPDYSHHVVCRDDHAVVFLNKYPTLYGYTLVAPVEHREQVTGDFSQPAYLQLQTVIYRVAEAVRQGREAIRDAAETREPPPKRLGSQPRAHVMPLLIQCARRPRV